MKVIQFIAAISGILFTVEAARTVQTTLQPPKDKQLSGVTLNSLAQSARLGSRIGFRPANGDVIKTARGRMRQRVVETYDGLEVVGAAAAAELDMNGQLTGHLYGSVVEDLQNDIPDPDACQRTLDEMLEIAVRAENYDLDDPHIDGKDGRRIVWVDPDTDKASLAYRVEFFYLNDQVVSRPAYFINACDKSVILHFEQVQNVSIARELRQTKEGARELRQAEEKEECAREACDPSAAGLGGNTKTGRVVYNTDGRCLDVEKSGSTCTMTNRYARVIDNEKRRTRFKQTPISFTCASGYDDPVNGAYGVASDAMYYGTITGRLYEDLYNVRALPYAPRLVVHYDSCFDNAFWDGTDMYFGDGCSLFFPLVSQDVVTHELGHGITTRNSNLIYSGKSGGINEAFSDISGEVGEMFGRGSNDWRVGYDLFQGERSLRYFINPPDDGRSIKYAWNFIFNMDVHHSSGVFNHAFYQMVAREGMPIYDAYKCFLDANLGIWSATTQYWRGACGVMQACYDNGFNHRKVRRAFRRVGLYLALCNFYALSSVMSAGETREDVLVSATRSPILQVESNGGNITIVAVAEDLSPVGIEVASDPGADDVVARGSDNMEVVSDRGQVYVRLSSQSLADIKVSMTIA